MTTVNEGDDESEFLTVRILAKLVNHKDDRFEKMFGGKSNFSRVQREELVLPVYDIVFDDFENPPDKQTQTMIHNEIQKQTEQSRELGKLIRETDVGRVDELVPQDKPQTESVEVGRVAVTPSKSGMIFEFQFENLLDLVDIK